MIPPIPVFSISLLPVKALSISSGKFDSTQLFSILCREDPSLFVDIKGKSLNSSLLLHSDSDSSQLENTEKKEEEYREGDNEIVVKGIGELHLDVMIDKLKREWNVDVNKGKILVAYKNCFVSECSHFMEYSKVIVSTQKSSSETEGRSVEERFNIEIKLIPDLDFVKNEQQDSSLIIL